MEDLSDRFDLINSLERNEVKHIDVESLALNLYQLANPAHQPVARPLVEIQELTLSGGDSNELLAS